MFVSEYLSQYRFFYSELTLNKLGKIAVCDSELYTKLYII